MSFYIGFVTKDMVTLAADRKFRCLGKPDSEACKLAQLDKNIWTVHVGVKFFGETWKHLFTRIKPKFLLSTYSGLKFISFFMHATDLYYQKKMKKYNIEVDGFNNIAIAGFKKGNPFIYAMDSSTDFYPTLCSAGSIYNCIERDEGEIDLYIKGVTCQLDALQKEGIARQKTFLRAHIAKIVKYLSEKHKSISSYGNIVFITPEGSVMESFNKEVKHGDVSK